MRVFLRRTLLVITGVGAVAGPLALYGAVEPDTVIGYATFRTGLALAPSEAAFLREYAAALRQFNGGYLPPDVDAFLADRWAHGSPSEQETAIDFYASQGSGRTGFRLALLGPAGIDPVLRYLEKRRSPEARWACLEFLEGMRRGRAFGKGGYCGALPLGEVEARYRAWWARPVPWTEKAEIDPLSGEGACWSDGP